MTNFLTWLERWKLKCQVQIRQSNLERALQKSPQLFREHIRISSDHEHPFKHYIEAWQKDDFEALDEAWITLAKTCATSTLNNRINRAYIERPRGHSKTSDMAIQLAWILQYSPHVVQGVAAAADKDQAALILQAISKLIQLNPQLCKSIRVRKQFVQNDETGSILELISSDVQSSWGILPDFVICDELCHWEKPELWYSLLSSASKKRNCLLIVLTNAGVGREWQWEVRENAQQQARWHFSSLDGPLAKWITKEAIQEQKQLLPKPVFERLWMNKWQHSDGEFVTLAEAEACQDYMLCYQEKGLPQHQYIAAIDYAEKRDYTVGVVLHREGDKLIVDRLDVVVPTPNEPTPVAWVEKWIHNIATNFRIEQFIIDEYQLLGTIQKLEGRYPLKRFEFAGSKGNHELAMTLRSLIVDRRLNWYAGCGQLPNQEERNDLETELASLIIKQLQRGRIRIDHHQRQGYHDDRAFALGAACLHAMKSDPTPDWMEIIQPVAGGGFLF